MLAHKSITTLKEQRFIVLWDAYLAERAVALQPREMWIGVAFYDLKIQTGKGPGSAEAFERKSTNW
jgi:hypothetical protein